MEYPKKLATGVKECLRCRKKFLSKGRFNRLCDPCNNVNQKVGKIYKADLPRAVGGSKNEPTMTVGELVDQNVTCGDDRFEWDKLCCHKQVEWRVFKSQICPNAYLIICPNCAAETWIEIHPPEV